MRQRTHQPQFAWLIFMLLNFVIFVSFVVSPLFFASFAVKSSPPTPAPGSSEGGHAGPPLPYNLFYVLFVVKSHLMFGCGSAALRHGKLSHWPKIFRMVFVYSSRCSPDSGFTGTICNPFAFAA